MTGKVVPQSWHPMFEFVQHFGGNEIVRVRTKFERRLKTIWLVFGDMKGSEQPDSIVMIGSHRDAMTFGAIDPGSGTTVLLQDADAFHALAQSRLEAEAHDRVRLVGRPRARALRLGGLHLSVRPAAAQERLSIHQHRPADDRRSLRRQRVARALRVHEADLRRRAGRGRNGDARRARSARRTAAQSDRRRLRSPELLVHARRAEHVERILRLLRRASHRRRQSSTDCARTIRACDKPSRWRR